MALVLSLGLRHTVARIPFEKILQVGLTVRSPTPPSTNALVVGLTPMLPEQ